MTIEFIADDIDAQLYIIDHERNNTKKLTPIFVYNSCTIRVQI